MNNSNKSKRTFSKFTRLSKLVALLLLPAELMAAGATLEEVVITARRVEESIQSAPLTVTAVGQQQLDDGLITKIEDIESLAPNVNIEEVAYWAGAISPYIRGIGTVDVESSFDPAIAVLVDGIYLSKLNGSMPSLFDIAQVEILRGPQGTVFGRNSLGGALNIVTRRPSGEFGFKAQATIGDFGQRDTAAFLEFPIIEDKLAAKISFQQNKFDGYYKIYARQDSDVPGFAGDIPFADLIREAIPALSANPNTSVLGIPGGLDLFGSGVSIDAVSPADFYDQRPNQGIINGDSYGGADLMTIRPTLTFRPNESVEISLLGEFARDETEPVAQDFSTAELVCGKGIINGARGDSCLPFVLDLQSTGPIAFQDLLQSVPDPVGLISTAFNQIGLDPDGITYVNGLVNALYALPRPPRPDNLDSSAYNVYYNRKGRLSLDTNGLYLEGIFEFDAGTLTVNTGFRETEIDSDLDADNTWIDLFNSTRFEKQEQMNFEARFSGDISDSTSYVVGFFYLDDEFQMANQFSGGGIAAFIGGVQTLEGSSRIPFSYAQSGTTGQFRESVALYMNIDHYWTDKLRTSFGGRYSTETKDFYFYQNGNCPPGEINPNNCQTIIEPSGRSTVFRDEKTWKDFSPKISMDYQFTDDILVYGLVAKAFRSGGYNSRAFDTTTNGPFEPESVTSYEIGLKSDLLDRTLRLNGAVFYNEYDDLQRESLVGLGAINVENAAQGTIEGFEIEIQSIPFSESLPGLSVNTSFGYLSTSYEGYFADVNADGVKEDLNNTEFIRAPRRTGSLNLSYTDEIGPGEILAQFSANYQDKSWLTVQNIEEASRKAGAMYDASLGYRMTLDSGSVIDVTVFGKNITDEVYQEYAQAVIGFFHLASLSPRERYGIRFTYEY